MTVNSSLKSVGQFTPPISKRWRGCGITFSRRIFGCKDIWSPDLSWDETDALIHLLMDQSDPALTPVMEEGLDAPDSYTRAVSVCFLSGDRNLFNTFSDDSSSVVEERVDAAIVSLRATRQRAN